MSAPLPQALPTPCEIIGDAHLGVAPPEAERELIAYLRGLPGRARSLVIMGDLFDFWFAWRHVMPRIGYRTLAALADLHEDGVQILWLGGNHDCWGGHELEQMTGAHYTLDAWDGLIGAWRSYLAHGDGLREKEDAPYRRLRRVLRHPLSIRAFSWLHPDHATALASTSSKTSRHHDRASKDEGAGLLAVATRQLAMPGRHDLVVHGHSHVSQLTPVGRGWYANAGAWYRDQHFLRIDGDTIERRHWTGSGESDRVDAGNRSREETTTERMKSIGSV